MDLRIMKCIFIVLLVIFVMIILCSNLLVSPSRTVLEQVRDAAQMYVSSHYPGRPGKILCESSEALARPKTKIFVCKVQFDDGTHINIDCVASGFTSGCTSSPLAVEFR